MKPWLRRLMAMTSSSMSICWMHASRAAYLRPGAPCVFQAMSHGRHERGSNMQHVSVWTLAVADSQLRGEG